MFFKNLFTQKKTGKTVSIVNCSLHKNGKTELMIKHLTEGLKTDSSTSVLCYNLHEMNIIPCNGCLACWYEHPNKCKNEDDLAAVLDSIFNSDALVLASPVWNGSGTHLFKIFIERIFPMLDPNIVKKEEYYHHERLPQYLTSDIYLLSGCSLPGKHNFVPVIEQIKALEYLFGFSLQGAILKDQCMELDFAHEKSLENLYNLFKKAGKELLTDPVSFQNTCENILNPIYKPDEYIVKCNYFFEKIIKKN